jgi:hypothetical protein
MVDVGDRVFYTRNSDNTNPTGTVIEVIRGEARLRALNKHMDGGALVGARVQLDPEWVAHVGHPVTIDLSRLRPL